jgi:hypothetical protein
MTNYSEMTDDNIGANVPDAQLLRDIELTELEVGAYKNLTDGYSVLASLPENAIKAAEYHYLSERFLSSLNECKRFLDKLYELKEMRGLYDDHKLF